MKLQSTIQVKAHIEKFIKTHSNVCLSGSLGTVGAWNVRLSKTLKEQLIAELLGLGVNILCLRNKANNKLEGEYFLTFHSDIKDLSETDAHQLMMMGFKGNKMFLDAQFAK